MTVYRRFGRREQLIEAMAIRETRRFIAVRGRDFIADGLRAAGTAHSNPEQAAETLARIFVSFLLLPLGRDTR